MRHKLMLTLILLALLASGLAQQHQQQDQQLIDEFTRTRGVKFMDSEPKKAAPKSPGKRSTARNKSLRKHGPAGGAKGGDGEAAHEAKKATPAPQGGSEPAPAGSFLAPTPAAAPETPADAASLRTLALGHTLYRKQGNNLVATDSSGEFTKDDLLRLFLESTADGYLYVFNTTNEAEQTMIYPYARVERGRNFVAASRRYYVPADDDEFRFVGQPGTERLYIVVSRKPLPGVPIGEELIAHCGGAVEGCYWKPTPAEWGSLKATFGRSGCAREGRIAQLAQLPPVEPEMLVRGIRVKEKDPPPAVVCFAESPSAELLVRTIDLVHK